MPTATLFKKSSSNSHPSNDGSAANVVENDKAGMPQPSTVSPDNAVPAYSDNIKELWATVHKEQPQKRGAEKFLDKIGEQTMVPTLAGVVMDTPQIVETIQKGVNTFMEAVPSLMKALDEVAKIHPFIAVAVLAFKAVYTLETKRRENDKRVLALYAEMKDMMAVFVDLNNVSDPKQIAPDGQTIEGRLQKLCETVAGDIRACANTCDTYIKKKLLVKIFAGSDWEGKLLAFVEVFAKRRADFELALNIHTTIGVDVANRKLDTITQRMDIMFQLFKEFVTPQQKDLAAKVNKMGGATALESEPTMRELASYETALTANPGQTKPGRGDRPFNFTELQQEIKSDPAEAIKKNTEFFDRKFDIQRRQIVEEIARTVGREGDRIISAVTSGPHDRIVDPDIYSIWRDMGWRGSVKARHFVMALKDYYIEKTAGGPDSASGQDGWALKYINIARARNLLEAFDDDASGFVTVNEVNNFTQSRPRGWSLPHWIAYWAIGWQMTCTTYCKKIEEIFDAMIRLLPKVLLENRQAVQNYVYWSWRQITVYVQSIKREEGTDDLRSRFESHVTAEEATLRQNFEGVRYRIDGSETFRVIGGKGRIEMTLFPALYLALKRDLEKISLAQKYVLSEDELWEALSTINSIMEVAFHRIESLRHTFEQQNLEPNGQFEVFAKGLYKIRSAHGIVTHAQRRDIPDPVPCRDEIIPDPESVSLSILNHPTGKRHELNFAAYDPPEPASCRGEGTHPMLGVYYGFLYDNGRTMDPMMRFTFGKGEGDNTFVATGSHFRGATYLNNYELTGTWDSPLENGKVPVEMRITYSTADWCTTDLKGVFDPEENSLKGTIFIPFWEITGEFVFKRDAEFVRFYPTPSLVNARDRWAFATKSVLDRVRRQVWSSKRISKKIEDGKRFMKLVLTQFYGRPRTAEESTEYFASLPGIYEADAQFYASLIKINLTKVTIFSGFSCDSCGAVPIEGSRIICMDCDGDTSVDLCSEPECVNSAVTFETYNRAPHSPNHRMFKVYRFVFDRDLVRIEAAAEDAIDSAREILSQPEEEDTPTPECGHCKTKVSTPCWYCMDCVGDKFICDNCERSPPILNEAHTGLHTIVRVTTNPEREPSAEERLQIVEEKLGRIEQILGKLVKGGNEPLTKGDLRAAVIELEPAQSEKKPEDTGEV